MPGQCHVNGCKNLRDYCPTKTFFKIPKDFDLREKWLRAVGVSRKSYIDGASIFVCQDHFKPTDLLPGPGNYNFTLANGAVPCIFKASEDVSIFISDKVFERSPVAPVGGMTEHLSATSIPHSLDISKETNPQVA